MHNTTNTSTDQRSVLALLRSVIPSRPLRFSEALRLAELQANRLLELTQIHEAPVPSEIVSELPRISVRYGDIPTSGMSYWNGENWVICLNRREPETRQRFTLLHEYKHILDHGRTRQLYTGSDRHSPAEQAEQAADYFAGCVLMPKRLIKRAWGEGLQEPRALALRFDVSAKVAEVRLAQVGLTESRSRCRSGTFSRTSATSRSPAWTTPGRSRVDTTQQEAER
jgi:Zn-dependent peptidase ImmA (M78 family)